MVVNIITPDDLQAFKEGFLKDLIDILDRRRAAFEHKWLKGEEVQRLLKISTRTMYTLRAQGALPYTRIAGTYYYAHADIQKMVDDNKTRQPERGRLLPGEEPEPKRRKL